MVKYVIKRILILIPIMLAVSFVVFSILYFNPGDPARIMLGASAPQEAVEQLREELGLNDPFLVQSTGTSEPPTAAGSPSFWRSAPVFPLP